MFPSNVGTRENDEPLAKIATKLPKIPKTKKKGAKVPDTEEPAVDNQCRDSFWEEMDWEPIEEEKVVVEVIIRRRLPPAWSI